MKRKSFRLTAAKLLNRLANDGLEQREFWKKSTLFSIWVSKKEITILKTAANILIDKSRQEKALRKQVRELIGALKCYEVKYNRQTAQTEIIRNERSIP